MQTVLIVIHLMVVLALVGVVLLQRSEGGALGVGGGSGFMTGRGQANVLTRATAILAALFFATSLGLTLMAHYGHSNRSILEGVAPTGPSQPAGTLPPKGQGSVLDQLRKLEEQRGAAPASGARPATSAPPTPASPAPATQTPATQAPSSSTDSRPPQPQAPAAPAK
jgi:preprotein translocase subunit SecG